MVLWLLGSWPAMSEAERRSLALANQSIGLSQEAIARVGEVRLDIELTRARLEEALALTLAGSVDADAATRQALWPSDGIGTTVVQLQDLVMQAMEAMNEAHQLARPTLRGRRWRFPRIDVADATFRAVQEFSSAHAAVTALTNEQETANEPFWQLLGAISTDARRELLDRALAGQPPAVQRLVWWIIRSELRRRQRGQGPPSD